MKADNRPNPMKLIPAATVFAFLVFPTLCLAGHRRLLAPDAPDTQSLVTAVTPTAPGQGTISISDNDTPFVVDAHTTIVIDGAPAALTDVQEGMEVISRSAPGTSASEIDLKKVDPAAAGNHKNQSQDSSN
jgi:hypothetical protein